MKAMLERYVINVFTALLLMLMWSMHRLPLRLFRFLARSFGFLMSFLYVSRKKIIYTNLKLCFPGWSESEYQRLVQRNFIMTFEALFDNAWIWWHNKQTVLRRLDLNIIEPIETVDQPIIFLLPHFTGLEVVGPALGHALTTRKLACLYAVVKNPLLNKCLYRNRRRYINVLLSRQQGVRGVVRHLCNESNSALLYLPDMNLSPSNSLFVPFFTTPAATTTGLSRLVKISDAAVFIVSVQSVASGYEVTVKKNRQITGDDIYADTLLMNQLIEDEVRQCPEQYFWAHRRFKTRPEGEPDLYKTTV